MTSAEICSRFFPSRADHFSCWGILLSPGEMEVYGRDKTINETIITKVCEVIKRRQKNIREIQKVLIIILTSIQTQSHRLWSFEETTMARLIGVGVPDLNEHINASLHVKLRFLYGSHDSSTNSQWTYFQIKPWARVFTFFRCEGTLAAFCTWP